MLKFFAVLVIVSGTVAVPIKDDLMFEGEDDTAIVESTVREARAAPSTIKDLIKPGVKDAFLYVYGDGENDDGDLHGYSKKMHDKGQDGYKHFDSFHKRDGDKYGYEKHSEYGQANKAHIDSENAKGIKKAEHESGEDDGEESRNSYLVIEELEDDKKQPKKSVESDYGYFGEGDGGANYFGEKTEKEGDGEGSAATSSSESSEGEEGDGDGEGENGSYESSEESEEGEGDDDY